MVSERFLFLARLSESPVPMGRSERKAAFLQKPLSQTLDLKWLWADCCRAFGKAGALAERAVQNEILARSGEEQCRSIGWRSSGLG
jgi:hypothetical protein